MFESISLEFPSEDFRVLEFLSYHVTLGCKCSENAFEYLIGGGVRHTYNPSTWEAET
jgi:hypothetical protein